MGNPQKKRETELVTIGLFSKRDAAGVIAGGCRHVHSSLLGGRDGFAQLTLEAVSKRSVPVYPWEKAAGSTTIDLVSSSHRYHVFRQVTEKSGFGVKREVREKLESVLEEMVTNAIYHAYSQADGTPKHPRHIPATLETREAIRLAFKSTESGIYLSVKDQGGALAFPIVSSSFNRCYGGPQGQIQEKEGGAGLGLYMIFEAATHVKIVVHAGKSTEIACWIADKRSFDPDLFSFNFFEEG